MLACHVFQERRVRHLYVASFWVVGSENAELSDILQKKRLVTTSYEILHEEISRILFTILS